MKILSVFSLVIVFHIAILGLLLIQPGCQSQPADKPDPAITQTAPEPAPVEPAELDAAFNAGIGSPAPASTRNLSSPQRPETDYRSQPSTSQMESVLEPVVDTYSLPAEKREVVVQKGDTLSAIAKREGISLSELLSSNGLTRNSTIYVGQTLFVPEMPEANGVLQSEMEHSGITVTVKSGDTLSAIAARHKTSVRDLKLVNGLGNDTIFVGQELLLPESATAPSQNRVQRQPQASFAAGMSTYVVEAGDTPSAIARKFGISSRELMTANNISDPRKLYIGRKLVIPEQGSTGTQRVQQPAPPPPVVETALPPTQSANSGSTGSLDPELDAMSTLEALEDEDLPYVEVEVVDEETTPLN